MRVSMAAVVAMYARIYGSSNGHVCVYLWAMYARIYGSSNGPARISIVVVMAM